jgi:hypothetical protein
MNTKTTFQPRTVGLLVTTLLAAVLSSCGNSLCDGRLVCKYYEPRRTYTQMMLIGKVWMPQVRVDDEDWVFMVKGFNGKDTITERFEVTEVWWNDAVVGSWVEFQDCR